MGGEPFSVHDQPDFQRVYDEDEEMTIRRGDLRALLDLATSSMDFASGFWDNEQVEIARDIAVLLGIDPVVVTPSNFAFTYPEVAPGYSCRSEGHKWEAVDRGFWSDGQPGGARWYCPGCRHTSPEVEMPSRSIEEEREGR